MTSRERIIKTIKGEKTDRVPISTYEIVAHDYWPKGDKNETASYDVLGFDYKSWYHRQESYRDLLKYIGENTDCFHIWFPDERKGLGKALTGADVYQHVRSWRDGISTYTEIVVETPRGPLTMKNRVDDNVNTIWELEHLLKNEEDVEKLLSIPYEPYKPDLGSYSIIDEKLGEKGVMLPNLGDPLLYVAELFGFTNFTVFSITHRAMVDKLLEVMALRVSDYLKYLLGNGVKGVYRIIGPEYATPPYLSPQHFKDFVVKYDTELIKIIHENGAIARVHSHGKVGKLLEYFCMMGADAIDPVEAPPYGDATLIDAKRRIGNEVCLIGNIQLRDLEILKEREIEEMVKRVLDEGAPGGKFVIMPTAAPINEPVSHQTVRNYYTLIDTALKHGKY